MSRNSSYQLAIKRRRWITLGWVGGLAVLVVGLLIFEQTEILYVLSTVGVTALLVVVALANLKDDQPGSNAVRPSVSGDGPSDSIQPG